MYTQVNFRDSLPFSQESVLYVRFQEVGAYCENSQGYSVHITQDLAWEIIEAQSFIPSQVNKNVWTPEKFANQDCHLIYVKQKDKQ